MDVTLKLRLETVREIERISVAASDRASPYNEDFRIRRDSGLLEQRVMLPFPLFPFLGYCDSLS
jgi:hypothetical protein